MNRNESNIIAQHEERVTAATLDEPKQIENSKLKDDQLELMIDQTLADSFPASDPPAWTLGRDQD